MTRVRTDIQMLFSRTWKDQIQGFSRTQKSFFPGLSRKHSIQNISCTSCHEVKKCIYKTGYQRICIKD